MWEKRGKVRREWEKYRWDKGDSKLGKSKNGK